MDLTVRLRTAAAAYRPLPLAADILLLRSEDDGHAADLGWGPVVNGRLTVEFQINPERHLQYLNSRFTARSPPDRMNQ